MCALCRRNPQSQQPCPNQMNMAMVPKNFRQLSTETHNLKCPSFYIKRKVEGVGKGLIILSSRKFCKK